jgi:hypothetical protein
MAVVGLITPVAQIDREKLRVALRQPAQRHVNDRAQKAGEDQIGPVKAWPSAIPIIAVALTIAGARSAPPSNTGLVSERCIAACSIALCASPLVYCENAQS